MFSSAAPIVPLVLVYGTVSFFVCDSSFTFPTGGVEFFDPSALLVGGGAALTIICSPKLVRNLVVFIFSKTLLAQVLFRGGTLRSNFALLHLFAAA